MLSAAAFHYLEELLDRHLTLLGDILSELLRHEHQDVVVQTASAVSVIGDGIQKLGENCNGFGGHTGYEIENL